MENCPKTVFFLGNSIIMKFGHLRILLSWNFVVIWEAPKNSAFGKRSFCLGDTRHFRHFRRFLGSKEQILLFWWVECTIRIFADFHQNHLFSAGDKSTVFQNDRFDNPDT